MYIIQYYTYTVLYMYIMYYTYTQCICIVHVHLQYNIINIIYYNVQVQLGNNQDYYMYNEPCIHVHGLGLMKFGHDAYSVHVM